jgi:hypothetical protein
MDVAPLVSNRANPVLVDGFDMDVRQENTMRMLLSFALLFVMAGSAHAQQTQPAATGDVPTATAVTTQAPAPVNLQKQTTTELKTVEPTERATGPATSSIVVEATNAAYADAVLQPSPTTRSWWYLVAAIVAAGIILYVIL